jgi:hypothetical protein
MIKINKLKTNLKGNIVSANQAVAGRQIENMMKEQGFPMQNGAGPDLIINNDTAVEVKSRDLNATSPHSVGGMLLDDIKKTIWEDSLPCSKCQQQLRVKHRDGIITEETMYDLSGKHCQSRLKGAYEAARQKIIAGDTGDYISGTEWGYFERTNKDSNTWVFRISHNQMKKLEGLAKSTINDSKLFEFTL